MDMKIFGEQDALAAIERCDMSALSSMLFVAKQHENDAYWEAFGYTLEEFGVRLPV